MQRWVPIWTSSMYPGSQRREPYAVLSCHTAFLHLFLQTTQWCLMQMRIYSHVSALSNVTWLPRPTELVCFYKRFRRGAHWKCSHNVYIVKVKLPIANSDHNTLQLIPLLYFAEVKQACNQGGETLVSWECGDIERLFSLCSLGSIDRHNEIRSADAKFCVDSVIPVKQVKHFPNNKPYITKEVNECKHTHTWPLIRRTLNRWNKWSQSSLITK